MGRRENLSTAAKLRILLRSVSVGGQRAGAQMLMMAVTLTIAQLTEPML